jgi:hypothetical protein
MTLFNDVGGGARLPHRGAGIHGGADLWRVGAQSAVNNEVSPNGSPRAGSLRIESPCLDVTAEREFCSASQV